MASQKQARIKDLLPLVSDSFAKRLKQYDKRKGSLSTRDCALAALSIFAFKYPSLLQFDNMAQEEPITYRNLLKLFDLQHVPSDTHMRVRLDEIDPTHFREAFTKLMAYVQRGKWLESYAYLDGHYLVSSDGTGLFSSNTIYCENCCVKKHKNGNTTYYHQMITAAMVHPDMRQVLPFAPEAILKQDGAQKNDCERNASKRFLQHWRREHPHMKIILLEDGLASNGPHLHLLKELNIRFITGAKPDDHTFLFDCVKHAEQTKLTVSASEKNKGTKGSVYELMWVNQVPLNDTHHDFEVNFLQCSETTVKGETSIFTWVTDLPITPENAFAIMRGGRARWKIENETFNTLKNQDYNFEHNYGHGEKNLATNMAMLMLLAFLMDQIQELTCRFYRMTREFLGSRRCLFENMRSYLWLVECDNFEDIYLMIIRRRVPDFSP